jgi:hypothetical protein
VSLDLEFTILLPGGGVFRFAGSFPVSCEQWQHIRQVMDAMAPGLVAVAKDDRNACPPPSAPCRSSPFTNADVGPLSPRTL